MNIKTVKVRTGGKVVEELSIDIFSSLDELLEAVSPDQIVAFYNRQKVENERNIARAKHQPKKAGKNKRFQLGFEVAYTNEELRPQLDAAIAAGNMDEFIWSKEVQDLVTEKMTEGEEDEE